MFEVIEGSFSAGQSKDGLQFSFSKLQEILRQKPLHLFSSMPYFALNEKSEGYKKEAAWLFALKEKVRISRERSFGTLTIGGDHSIGMSTVAGVLEAAPDTAVLWIDAHADFNTYESSITKNLHGMPVNALLNGGKKAINKNFAWLKPVLKREKFAIIGLRDVDPLEKVLLEDENIICYWADDVREKGLENIIEEVRNRLNPSSKSDFHISLDVDFLDPKEFPQTGLPILKGFSLDNAIQLIESFKPKSLDIVEWNAFLPSSTDCQSKVLKVIEIFENLLYFELGSELKDVHLSA